MLPSAQPLSAQDARRWARAGVPRGVTTFALTGLWLAVIVISFATDGSGGNACVPQHPCGPDAVFTWFVVVMVATPILLVWLPALGCAAGLAFGVADFRNDQVPIAGWAFLIHGLLCGVVGLLLVRGIGVQRRAAAELAGPARAPAVGNDQFDGGQPLRSGFPLRVVSALLLTALASLLWYDHQVDAENAHLDRAVRVEARVAAVNDDGNLRVDAAVANSPVHSVQVSTLETFYQVGDTVPVLLDPRDDRWARLVAEPADSTGWQSLAIGAAVLTLLVSIEAVRRRRGLIRLRAGGQPMLRVRIRRDGEADAVIIPVSGGEQPIAWLPCAAADAWEAGPDRGAVAELGRKWRGEVPLEEEPGPEGLEDAVLVGDLRDRGITMLITADQVLAPNGRLRLAPSTVVPKSLRTRLRRATLPRMLGRNQDAAEDATSLFAGVPLQPAAVSEALELPVLARPPARTRLLGALMMLAATAVGMLAVWFAPAWYPRIVIAVGAGRLLAAGAIRVFGCLRVEYDRFEVSDRYRIHMVPWGRLHGVRLDESVLRLAWEPDVCLDVGPFGDEPADTGPGWHSPEEHGERLGATMLLQRQRSLLSGLPDRAVTSRPSVTWLFLAGYALVLVVTAVVRWG